MIPYITQNRVYIIFDQKSSVTNQLKFNLSRVNHPHNSRCFSRIENTTLQIN